MKYKVGLGAHIDSVCDHDDACSYGRRNVGERLRRFGYRWSTYGENIAVGSGSYRNPENRFKVRMNSSGHRANILNKNVREIGIGAYTRTYKSYSNWTMWTADFGGR